MVLPVLLRLLQITIVAMAKCLAMVTALLQDHGLDPRGTNPSQARGISLNTSQVHGTSPQTVGSQAGHQAKCGSHLRGTQVGGE